MPGHPDGQNYAIWRGPNFIATNTFSLSNSNPLHVSGQVTNYASLFVNADASPVGGIDVLVRWYQDATLLNQLFEQEWTFPNPMQLKALLPCIGNYVTVDITTPTVAGTATRISVYPTNTVTPSAKYMSDQNARQVFNSSIPANTTVLTQLPYIAGGHGYVYVADINSTAHLTGGVVTLNEDGTAKARVAHWNTLTSFQAQEFVTDAEPLGIFIQNTDGAAAHVVEWYLTVDGHM